MSEMVRNSHSEFRTATTVEGILPILPKNGTEKQKMSSDLAAMDSCFGLVGPRQHGTAKS